MILTIGSIKGGCGKSLIATNLTVLQSEKKRSVLLVDGDEQGTSGDWSDHRTNLGLPTSWTTIRLRGNAVRSEVLKLKSNYDDIIIDCGGRDTSSLRAALTVSNIFLIPFQPKSFDIWTATKVSALVEEVAVLNPKLQTYAFINCAASRGTDNDDAKKILSQLSNIILLDQTVGLRKSFSNATSEGLGVSELKTDKKATQEIQALCTRLFEGEHGALLTHQLPQKQVNSLLF